MKKILITGGAGFIAHHMIGNRVRDYNTLSSEVSSEDIQNELSYCHRKYGIT